MRKFEGPSLDDLLEHVYRECGAQARIVEANRVRRGGVGGFFAREGFEVLVEPDPQHRPGAETPAGSDGPVRGLHLDVVDVTDDELADVPAGGRAARTGSLPRRMPMPGSSGPAGPAGGTDPATPPGAQGRSTNPTVRPLLGVLEDLGDGSEDGGGGDHSDPGDPAAQGSGRATRSFDDVLVDAIVRAGRETAGAGGSPHAADDQPVTAPVASPAGGPTRGTVPAEGELLFGPGSAVSNRTRLSESELRSLLHPPVPPPMEAGPGTTTGAPRPGTTTGEPRAGAPAAAGGTAAPAPVTRRDTAPPARDTAPPVGDAARPAGGLGPHGAEPRTRPVGIPPTGTTGPTDRHSTPAPAARSRRTAGTPAGRARPAPAAASHARPTMRRSPAGLAALGLAGRFSRLPPAPAAPTGAALVAVVGPRDEALSTADRLAGEDRATSTTVVLATRRPAPGHPPWALMSEVDDAVDRARRRSSPLGRAERVVVAVDLGRGRAGLAWAQRMLAALRPDQIRMAVHSDRDHDEAAATVQLLGGIDVIDVVVPDHPVTGIDPDRLLRLGAPVATIAGLPATAGLWAALALDRHRDGGHDRAPGDRHDRDVAAGG